MLTLKDRFSGIDVLSLLHPKEKRLFAGEPISSGGLTNERELVRICPETFRRGNDWSYFAMRLKHRKYETSNWMWKSKDLHKQHHQLERLQGILRSLGLELGDMYAVAGWMLSEMLTQIPELKIIQHD